jgi:hypothetical protein
MNIKVKNLVSPSGNEVANQFEITVGGKVYFQSYQTIIAVYDQRTGKTTLDKNKWDYSTTTGKYRNMWLADKSKAETEKKIKSGYYKLRDLNKEQ